MACDRFGYGFAFRFSDPVLDTREAQDYFSREFNCHGTTIEDYFFDSIDALSRERLLDDLTIVVGKCDFNVEIITRRLLSSAEFSLFVNKLKELASEEVFDQMSQREFANYWRETTYGNLLSLGTREKYERDLRDSIGNDYCAEDYFSEVKVKVLPDSCENSFTRVC